MRKTTLPVALFALATVGSVVGMAALAGHSSAKPAELVTRYLAGTAVPTLLTLVGALTLFRIPRLVAIGLAAGVTVASVLAPLFSAAFTSSIEVADGFTQRSALTDNESGLFLAATIAWAVTIGFSVVTLMRRPLRVRWLLALLVSPVAAVVVVIAYLTPLPWAAYAVALIVSLLLSPRRTTDAVIEPDQRRARQFAWTSLVTIVVVWVPFLALSIASTGTDDATTALGRGLAGSQLAAIPLLCSATVLFAPRGHRGVRAALVGACATAVAASTFLLATGSLDGNLMPLVMLLGALGPGVWLATLVSARVRLPQLQQVVLVATLIAGGACIWAAGAMMAGAATAIVAITVIVLARQPSAASSFAVSSAVSK